MTTPSFLLITHKLEEVGKGDLAGVGTGTGEGARGASDEVDLGDGGGILQGEVVGDADLDMLEEDGTNTDVPTEGGGIVYPATLHGMTGGLADAGGDIVLAASYVHAELGTGVQEPVDHVLKVDAITDMEGELEGGAIDGLAVSDVLGGGASQVEEGGDIEAEAGLVDIVGEHGADEETGSDLVDIALVGVVADMQLADVQAAG